MKVAARFPIQAYLPLVIGYLIFQLIILMICFLAFGLSWQLALILVIISISTYYSIKYYHQITDAIDDLCWSGENWLFQNEGHIHYLEVQAGSWLSNKLSLLYFKDGDDCYYWLFARANLGARQYSELVYLVKQSLRLKSKQ